MYGSKMMGGGNLKLFYFRHRKANERVGEAEIEREGEIEGRKERNMLVCKWII